MSKQLPVFSHGDGIPIRRCYCVLTRVMCYVIFVMLVMLEYLLYVAKTSFWVLASHCI